MNDAIFDGLDAIDWVNLNHAYGSAEDTPRRLRELISSDAKTRDEALDRLIGSVFHQGTNCQATGYVIPFLIRMVQVPDMPLRQRLFALVQDMAEAYSEELPWLENYERIAEARNDSDYETKVATFRSALVHTRQALLASYKVYVASLDDPDPEMRKTAVLILRELTEHIAYTEPIFRQRIEAETHGVFKSLLLSALTELWCRTTPEQFSPNKSLTQADLEFLLHYARASDESPDVRFAAALEVVRLFGETFIDETVPVFLEGLAFVGGATRGPHRESLRLLRQFSRTLACLGGKGIASEAILALSRTAVGNPASRWKTLATAQWDVWWKLQNRPRAALAWYLASSQSPDPVLRTEATRGMVRLAEAWRWMPPLVAPRLVEMLQDKDSAARFRATEALRSLGETAEVLLTEALPNQPPSVRASIKKLLAQIHAQKQELLPRPRGAEPLTWSVDRLTAELKKRLADEEFRGEKPTLSQLIAALSAYGLAAQAAIPPLRSALQKGDQWLHVEAAEALLRIEPIDTKYAQSTLVAELTVGTYPGARLKAARVLWEFDSGQANLVASTLINLLDAESARFELYKICELLYSVDPAKAPLLVTKLTAAIHYDHTQRSVIAFELLGKMGSVARPALPELYRIATSDRRLSRGSNPTETIAEDELICRAAQQAIEYIENAALLLGHG